MTSTRERQRAAARARLEKEMAERAARARARRRTQAYVGAGVVVLLVIAGTVWLVASNVGDDKKGGTPQAATTQCSWTELPPDQRSPQVKDVGLPPLTARKSGSQIMTMDTNLGPITTKLDLSLVPCTAASFTHLASKKFFDNTKCHRLVNTDTFKVLQCGDPGTTGKGWRDTDGTGGPSYTMAEENLPTDKRPPYPDGIIAMAKTSEPNSTGSQFFIVFGDSQLDPSYTVLGTVTAGMDIVKQIGAAGDDGAFAAQAGGGHPKKELDIKTLTMSAPQD